MTAVLVSGGTGGLGTAICRQLAQCGFRSIVGFRRDAAAAQRIATETGGTTIPLDLADPGQIEAAVATLAAADISGLVLAAAPPPRIGALETVTEDELMRHWRVSVLGPQRLLTGMIKQCFKPKRRGTIVGVLTAAMANGERSAMKDMGAYLLGKHGLAGLLAVAAADYPWLRVRSISPGFIETGMLEAFEPRLLQLLRDRDPRKRFDLPDEVAAEIVSTFYGR